MIPEAELAALRAHGDPEMHVVAIQDVLAVDLSIDLRDLAQRRRDIRFAQRADGQLRYLRHVPQPDGKIFLVALFFIPLIEPLQQLKFAYGPALIAVGVLMVSSIRRIAFDDLTELLPAFVTVAVMVFTYNIGNGLTAGLVLYPLLKILAGRWQDLNGGNLVLGVACLVYYLFGLPH